MKKITGIFFALAISCVGLFNLNASSTLGFNLSDAPGEGSCASCHIGNLNPDIIGSVKIFINGQENLIAFTPDSTYNFEVISNYPGISKFGFALNARYSGVEFQNVGEFIEAGDSGVHVSDYVTHNLRGSKGENTKSWKFKWKAPAVPQNETINFYAAAVMGNNDESTRGDLVFTKMQTLKNSATGFMERNIDANIQLLQIPEGAYLKTSHEVLTLKINSIEGKSVPFNQVKTTQGIKIMFPFEPNNCIYIVSVQTKQGWWAAKTSF